MATTAETQPSPDILSTWLEAATATAILLDKKATTEHYWKNETRADGRLLSQCRTCSIRSQTQNGALVQLGDTQVLAGVTLMVGQIVSGNQGDVQVRVTSCWQGAGGDRDAQQQQLQQYLVLQSYVQRLLDDTLELTQLVIAQGQTAFSIQLFLQIVSDDGNLKDACLLAAVTALHDLQIPTNPLLLDKKVLLRNNDTYTNFKLECLPVSLSLGIWKNNHHESNKKPIVIVDPTLDEDSLLTSHMTVIVNANNLLQILSLDMSSSSSDSAVPASVIALAVKMAQARAKEVMETIWKRPIDTA